MIPRQMAARLLALRDAFPVVTLEGPRQSGKTTLCKAAFPDYAYANLEMSDARDLARTDPRGFFRQFPPPVVVDEVQRVPELLSEIQVLADERGRCGQFILTGSHQPRLREGIAQTLAGRTALATLLPLSLSELAAVGQNPDREECIFRGFLPSLYDRPQNPTDLHEAYYRTYVERDVRLLVNLSHQDAFERFLRLLAGRVGREVNLEGMSGEAGVSATTLREWMGVLEASFVIFRLQPYYRNFGKRFTKSPKVYFTDVGLAAHLLGIRAARQVSRDPLFGGLFENLVVTEALKAQRNRGIPPSLYYVRERSGAEIDLLVESGRQLHLFEIKSGMTPNLDMGRHLAAFRKRVPEAVSSTVVYSGEPWPLPPDGRFVNFRDMGAEIERACASA